MIRKLHVYSSFKILKWKRFYYRNKPVQNLLGGTPYDYSCTSTKDSLMEGTCKNCDLFFGSMKQKLNHDSRCRSRRLPESWGDQEEPMNWVPPQRIEVHHQRELLCAMAFQEFKWHTIQLNGTRNFLWTWKVFAWWG